MIRLLTAVFLFASFHAVADDLKTFSDGQVINADDFNHNFQKLEQDIANGVAGPQGDTGDTGPQGPAGPAGADGVAAGLNCTTDQSIVYRGDAWVCSSPEYVEVLGTGQGFLPLSCPSGKMVTGGGCLFTGDNCGQTQSKPALGLNGWECYAYSCTVTAIYAVCQ